MSMAVYICQYCGTCIRSSPKAMPIRIKLHAKTQHPDKEVVKGFFIFSGGSTVTNAFSACLEVEQSADGAYTLATERDSFSAQVQGWC